MVPKLLRKNITYHSPQSKLTNVNRHYCKIEDKDDEFYRQFSLVVCGLDSLQARRWINAKLVSLVKLTKQKEPIPSTIIPMIDGGTEGLRDYVREQNFFFNIENGKKGFKGHVKVVVPKLGPCFECLLPTFPPARKFALCTIQSTPRLPEHCIAYVKIIQWGKDTPFRTSDDKPQKVVQNLN